jgi:hypothetical protein
MAILIEDTNDYTPASEGTHIAVLCDAEEMGVLDTKDGPVPRLRLTFQLTELTPGGRRQTASCWCTRTTKPKSKLRGIITTLVGDNFPKPFDVETLLGSSCLIRVEHQTGKDGNLYGTAVAVMPLPRDVKPITVKDYVRRKDRDDRPSGFNGSIPRIISKPRSAAAPDPEPAPVPRDGISENDLPKKASPAAEPELELEVKPEPKSEPKPAADGGGVTAADVPS